MKSALAIGGVSALATTSKRIGFTGTASAGHGVDVAERTNRQHAWADYLTTDGRGVATPPSYHVVLFLNYQATGEPTAADRAEMESALRQLERAFDWSDEGLLFTVNYGRPYFDRFDADLPPGARLLDNEASAQAMVKRDEGFDVNEDPATEPYDLFVDLASNTVTNVLAAEEALWGNVEELDGVAVEHTFEGLFEKPTEFPDRRTGFVGRGVAANDTDQARDHEEFGNPNERIDERADENAFLTMGFQSNFPENQATEDDVSLVHDQRFTADADGRPPGPFAQGTVQHASRLSIDVETWYDDNLTARRTRMFSPEHDEEGTGRTGHELGEDSSPEGLPMRDADADDDVARRARDVAVELRDRMAAADDEGAAEAAIEEAVDEGTNIGHSQKLARARMDPGTRRVSGDPTGTRSPLLARRDFNTLDGAGEFLPNTDDMAADRRDIPPNSALHFLALMRFNEDVVVTRQAMNEVGFTAPDGSIDHEDVPEVEDVLDPHGIHEYIVATRRGNFLMPPLTLRSLPPADAVRAAIEVEAVGGDAPTGVVDTGREEVRVTVTDDGGATLDTDAAQHVQFGPIERVNRARGAEPASVTTENGETVLVFDVADLDFDPGDARAKLSWIDGDGIPIEATTDVRVATRSLLVNDYDGDPPWPNGNDLGTWNGAGGFRNGGGSGEVVDGALALEYDGAGWVQEGIRRDLTDLDRLVFRLRGEVGGEGSQFRFELGGVTAPFADVADAAIATAFSTAAVDLEAAGVDGSAPGDLRLDFSGGQSGPGTVYVDEIWFE